MPNNIRNQPMYWRSGGPATENEASLLYPGMLGSKETAVEKADGYAKTHQLVGTDSTMSVAPFDGAVAWWADKTKYQVTTSPTTLGRGRIAGVFRTAVTRGNYCGIQTQGRHPRVKFIDAVAVAPSAVGLAVIPSATAGKADTIAAGGATTYPTLGMTAGTYDATNATGVVDLDVPETP